jgi:DNA-binding transcriptional MocR family regulator
MTVISFARGVPPVQALPIEELADCARAAIQADGANVLNYGPVAGYGPLRQWIADRHGVDPGRVLVTNGSLEGLNLVLAHFAERGRILVEAPTYDRPLKIAARLGARLEAVPQDVDGLDIEALEASLRRDPAPALLYVLPTFQNPSGRTLPLSRRQQLVELAREHDLTILEDDPYGEVRFEGQPLPTLHDLDPDRVLRSSSFSKVVSPGVRVGYFVLPAEVAGAIEAVATNVYLTPSLVAQATVYEFLRRGALEPHLLRVCDLLRERRDAMLAALETHFGQRSSWSQPHGGYFLWLDLPAGTDAADLLSRATAAGVTFVPGVDFFPSGTGGTSSARLAYSFASPAEIWAGIERLGALLREVAPLAVPV